MRRCCTGSCRPKGTRARTGPRRPPRRPPAPALQSRSLQEGLAFCAGHYREHLQEHVEAAQEVFHEVPSGAAWAPGDTVVYTVVVTNVVDAPALWSPSP